MRKSTIDALTCTRILAAILAIAGVQLHAFGVTWRVERDGSGDFTTIPPAAAAAAAGDTIRLGPGHYTEYAVYKGGEKVSLNYYVLLNHNDITIIGVDADVVTIGPVLTNGFDGIAVGISSFTSTGYLRIEGITFAHSIGGVASNEQELTVRRCKFLQNYTGIQSSATGSVLVEDCEFIENSDSGVLQADVTGTPLFIVRNCLFLDNSYGIDSQESNNLVERCTFIGNYSAAVQYSLQAAGAIRTCTFDDNDVGIRLSNGTIAELTDNQILGGELNLGVTNSSYVAGTGNIFGGASYATMDFTGQATASMSNNHILQGTSQYRVRVRSTAGSGHIIDLRNNYWGTSSPQVIAASIFDSQDNPTPIGNVTGTVLFEPFYELPVTAHRKSFGEMKRLFSPEN